jgi:glutathione peroxidase
MQSCTFPTLFTSVALLLFVACGSNDPSPANPAANQAGTAGTTSTSAGGSSSTGGSQNQAGTAGTSISGQAGQSGNATAGAGGSGGSSSGSAGAPEGFVCSPAANANEIYAIEAKSIEQTAPISMCEYRGKVMLIVNGASKCKYTYQYGPLQTVYDKYKAQGLEVLGFPCNQFGGQDPGSDEEISQFCTENFGIQFPIFSKIDVNGANTHPLYVWLKGQDGFGGDVQWNFEKFLISRTGKVLYRWKSDVEPTSPEVSQAIEAALAEPAPNP